jgi:hypothetical protein
MAAPTGVCIKGMFVVEGEWIIFLGNFFIKIKKYSYFIVCGIFTVNILHPIKFVSKDSMASEIIFSFLGWVEET